MHISRRTALGWIATLPLPAAAQPGLMLAREATPDVDPAGYLVSEKLDGVRALWDGQALRFRSGLPIAAPAWFTAALPAHPLDGELWAGRGQFEVLAGTVRKSQPVQAEWRQVSLQLFDLPGGTEVFAKRAAHLQSWAAQARLPFVKAVPQERIASPSALRRRLDDVLRAGGEGLVLHRADAAWSPGRSDALLKLKPVQDEEATVVGHVPGRGRLEGKLGALRLSTDEGVQFLLGSGFTDAQRTTPPPVGSVVTYAYRGRTASGVPRFASFLRMREL